MKRRKIRDGIKTGVCALLRDKSGGYPLIGQTVSGVKAARAWSAATTGNVGKRVPTLRSAARKSGGWREGARCAAETVRR
jgi:hypothetical protein